MKVKYGGRKTTGHENILGGVGAVCVHPTISGGFTHGSLWLIVTWKHQVLPTPRPSNPIELITIPNVVLSALLPVAIITVIQSVVTILGVLWDVCVLCVCKQLPNKPVALEESVRTSLLIDGGYKMLWVLYIGGILYVILFPLYVFHHYSFPLSGKDVWTLCVLGLLWVLTIPGLAPFAVSLPTETEVNAGEWCVAVRWFCYHGKNRENLTP